MSDPHMRHLPETLRDAIALDLQIEGLRRIGDKTWKEHMLLRDLKAERASLTAGLHRVYGHTPSRGDRGPHNAGAMVA